MAGLCRNTAIKRHLQFGGKCHNWQLNGVQLIGGTTLGVSPQAISQRIGQAAEDSVLATFRGTFIRSVSDDEIAAALTAHGTQTAAAKALGIAHGTVSRRIAQAAEDSALYAFKGKFKPGRSTNKASDDELAVALREHGTQKAAAAALGVSHQSISRWIAQAAEDSALGIFKGTFKPGWPRKKVSDDEIAAALTVHDTQAAAAKALGIPPLTVSRRIARATEDSSLYVFKGTFKRGRRKRHQ